MSAHGSTPGAKDGWFKTGLKLVLIIIFAPIGLIIAAVMFGSGATLIIQHYQSYKAERQELAALQPLSPAAAAKQKAADELRAIREATISYNEAWSGLDAWQEYWVSQENAAIFQPEMIGRKGVTKKVRHDRENGESCFILKDGEVCTARLSVDEKNGEELEVFVPDDLGLRYQISVVDIDGKKVNKWHPQNKELPEGALVLYWDPTRPILADLASKFQLKGKAGIYIPVAQRRLNGTGYNQAWMDRALLDGIPGEGKPAPGWEPLAMSNADKEAQGVYQRYVSTLQPGDTTATLVSHLPYKSEEREKAKQGLALFVTISTPVDTVLWINGERREIAGGEEEDISSSKPNVPGIWTVKAHIPEGCGQREVAIAWTVYWKPATVASAT